MGAILSYMLSAALCLSVLTCVYKLTLSNVKQPGFNRMLLLAIMAVAMLLPAAGSLLQPAQEVTATSAAAEIQAPVYYSADHIDAAPATQIPWLMIAAGIWCVGAGVFSLLTIADIIIGLVRIRRGDRMKIDNAECVVVKSGRATPYTFLGKIFLSPDDLADRSLMMLRHEQSHIRHHHGLDLVIARIVLIALWWNPFVWVLLHELQSVHEYQADNDVVSGEDVDARNYQYMLLNHAAMRSGLGMVSGFAHHRLKKRLLMINRSDSGSDGRLRGAWLIPAVLVSLSLLTMPFMVTASGNLSEIYFSDSDDEYRSPVIVNTEEITRRGDTVKIVTKTHLDREVIPEKKIKKRNKAELRKEKRKEKSERKKAKREERKRKREVKREMRETAREASRELAFQRRQKIREAAQARAEAIAESEIAREEASIAREKALREAAEQREHASEQREYAKKQREYAAQQREYAAKQREYAKKQREYAAQQREYAAKQREYAARQREYAAQQREYAAQQREYASKQRQEALKQAAQARKEAAKARKKAAKARKKADKERRQAEKQWKEV